MAIRQLSPTTINRIAGGKPPTVAQFNTSKQYHEVVAEGLLNDIVRREFAVFCLRETFPNTV